jgi:eukaryotic-like serine/threonine-protein kinase
MPIFDFVTKRPLWINMLVAFLLVVLFLFLLSTCLGPITHHNRTKSVPNVVGKSYEQAKDILDDGGFDVEVSDSIFTDTIPKGSVLRQVPEGNSIVKKSRTVYLTINRYVPPVVEMPNLIDFSYRNAELQLKNMGLKVGDTSYIEDFALNTVREMRFHNGEKIAPGTRIPQGTRIDLVLANGGGTVTFTVPNLIGMTFGNAKKFLESNGLSFSSIIGLGPITDTLNSYVVDQDPKRVGEDGKRITIKSGQTMNVWLSMTRPAIDSALIQGTPEQ